ncbi:ComF family protein [Ensifer soli]|uniref:ComF family protein n=1 Tax=Ciceribacter sp. sgz301302 TaxID=3342379 RepID=UPI0035BB4FEF
MAGEDGEKPAAASQAAAVLRWLAACLYPPVCPGCGRLTGRHSALCAGCWQEMPFIARPYCEILGLPFARDHGEGAVSPLSIAAPPVFDRLRSAALHEGVARRLVHGLKYRDRTDLVEMMAGWMVRAGGDILPACDAVVAVPLHPLRLMGRKFNQSAELARSVARQAGKPFLADGLQRHRHTMRQVGLGARQRAENVRGAFAVPAAAAPEVFGRAIVLVDDVYTTGATVSAATRALKRAGAASVAVLTFARVMTAPI